MEDKDLREEVTDESPMKKSEDIESPEASEDAMDFVINEKAGETEVDITSSRGLRRKNFKKPELPQGFWYGTLAGAVLVLLIWVIFRVTSKDFEIFFLIKQYALTEATSDDIENGKYSGMLASLGDNYAAYYSAEETAATKQEKSGTYSGIGVLLAQDPESGAFFIQGVYEGSSAAEKGVQPGDILLEVNGETVEGMEVGDISSKIAGLGSRVPLKMKRGEDIYEVILEVRKVEVPRVYHTLLEDGIGYIAMDSFIMTTGKQFTEAIRDLTEQNMKGLIVDLRGNGGGFVDTAVEALDSILPKGTAVYTMDKNGKRNDYKVKGATPLSVPLVILVDGRTASASEIFSGACRDLLGATLIGTKTYGKGIVQTTYTIIDGSSVRFTTSHYYTPNGTDINGNGLEPDIEAVPTPAEGEKTVVAMSAEDTPFVKAVEYLESRIES